MCGNVLLFNDPTQPLSNNKEGFVLVLPEHDCFAIAWQALQASKRRALPIARTSHAMRNELSLSTEVALERPSWHSYFL